MVNNLGRRRKDVEGIELVGGSEKRHLELVGYYEGWVSIFLEHQARLWDVLGPAAVEVEHIGSTAVPGLAAKPIVDIVVTVDDVTAEEDYFIPLVAAGYELRIREPGHRLVRTRCAYPHPATGRPGCRQLPPIAQSSPHGCRRPRVVGRAKRALLQQGFDDMNAYANAKSEVIAAIIERAPPDITSKP
ncbi:GrpB family protein [Subtercola sp. RTI3]|uniref:GrpB family protein n=1 Tax=Subtercola sp. RTI3 TaxID=3048639 RepID=UPI002B233FFF|nr:GrpB family protein [Subtercola sp. RTI3]